ncbi:MAG: FAD-dependent oxidoreductase [Firmicutes bacterium]|nr:FAD-dependent oxidoreductase [Bacillota bacterium]
MYDVIIVGGGPAGMTAALYAVRNGKSALVIEKAGFGGQITHSPKVENIPGFTQLSGNEFADQMLEQILHQGAEIEIETVTEIKPGTMAVDSECTGFTVITEEGSEYEGRTVIIATGVKHRMLGLQGEDALVGEGISFCAVCDGDFYSGKKVCVAGGGNSALQEAILLSEKCTEVVMLQDMDFFTGEAKLQEVLFSKPNVKTYTGVKINKLLTEGSEEEPTLVGVEIEHTSASGTVGGMGTDSHAGSGAPVGAAAVGTTETINCDGLFVAIGLIPENEAFKEFADLNEYGYFDTDEHCVTKTPGIFVAGDCRSKFVRQVTTAAADGAVAALAACRYVNGL